MQFYKKKSKVLHIGVGGGEQMHKSRKKDNWLGSSIAEKGLGGLAGYKLNVSW